MVAHNRAVFGAMLLPSSLVLTLVELFYYDVVCRRSIVSTRTVERSPTTVRILSTTYQAVTEGKSTLRTTTVPSIAALLCFTVVRVAAF